MLGTHRKQTCHLPGIATPQSQLLWRLDYFIFCARVTWDLRKVLDLGSRFFCYLFSNTSWKCCVIKHAGNTFLTNKIPRMFETQIQLVGFLCLMSNKIFLPVLHPVTCFPEVLCSAGSSTFFLALCLSDARVFDSVPQFLQRKGRRVQGAAPHALLPFSLVGEK